MTNRQATESALESALKASAAVLRRVAESRLPAHMVLRIEQLSQDKEFLDRERQVELRVLAGVWRQRLVQKLEARVALERVRDLSPDLVNEPEPVIRH